MQYQAKFFWMEHKLCELRFHFSSGMIYMRARLVIINWYTQGLMVNGETTSQTVLLTQERWNLMPIDVSEHKKRQIVEET